MRVSIKMVMGNKKTFIILLILNTLTFPMFGQVNSLPINAVNELTGVWNNHFPKSQTTPAFVQDWSIVQKTWPVPMALNQNNRIKSINQYYDIKSAALRADAGISWSATTQQNFSPQPGEDNLFFRSKMATGIQWDLLSGGLMENEHKARVVENQKQIELLGIQQERANSVTFEQRNALIYYFNKFKLDALRQKQSILDEEIAIVEKLVENKTLLLPILLDAYKSKIEVTGLIQTYQSFNESMRPYVDTTLFTYPELLPLFDINPKALRTLCNHNDASQRQIILAEEAEQMQYNWMNDVKLNGNLRYNYFDMVGLQSNRGYISMGVQAEIPLKIFHADYKAGKNIQLQKEKWRIDQEQEAIWSEVSNLFYEFRYKLKQYAIKEAQRKLTLEQLSVYQQQAQHSSEYFLPLTALQSLVEYWDIAIEQMDLHQQLYLKLGDIRKYIPQENVIRFTKPWDINAAAVSFDEENNIVIPQQNLFIWSKSWMGRKPTDIATQAFQWGIDQVYLSPSSDRIERINFNELIQSLQQKDIASHLLVGKNKWLNGDITAHLDSLYQLYGKSAISGLHLDIEPHTIEGYKDSSVYYQNLYIARLKEAKTFCDLHGWTLGISIPLFYPESFLQLMQPLVDEVVLMAYETSGPESIQRRISEEVAIFGNKINIALRCKDYSNKVDMQKDFDAIRVWHSSQKTSIHDYETYLLLNQ